MRKYLRFAPILALGAGVVSMVLRFIMVLLGTDDKGLYPGFSLPWVLTVLISLLVAVALFFISRQADPQRSYRDNFPTSFWAAGGNLLAAAGFAVTSLLALLNGNLFSGILGILCCLGLGYAGFLRLKGSRPPFFIHAILCLYFILRIFAVGKLLGSEPELSRFLLPFFADLVLLLACYQKWGFDVKEGDRRKSIFWSLLGAYLCIAAIAENSDWFLFLCLGLWLVTDLCSLKPVRRIRKATPEEAAEVEAPQSNAEEIPEAISVEAPEIPDIPVDGPQEASEVPLEELDTDAFIALLLKDLEE